MGFSRQEYWSGLPCASPGDLPNPQIEPRIESRFAGRFFTVRNTREAPKEYWPDNKQHGIPAKWSLHCPRETKKDALGKQVLSDLLGWYRVNSSIKGFPASSIVNFKWHDTQGQFLSFLQKNGWIGWEVHKKKVWETDSKWLSRFKKSQLYCLLNLFLNRYLLQFALEYFPLPFGISKWRRPKFQLVFSYCWFSLWITGI